MDCKAAALICRAAVRHTVQEIACCLHQDQLYDATYTLLCVHISHMCKTVPASLSQLLQMRGTEPAESLPQCEAALLRG